MAAGPRVQCQCMNCSIRSRWTVWDPMLSFGGQAFPIGHWHTRLRGSSRRLCLRANLRKDRRLRSQPLILFRFRRLANATFRVHLSLSKPIAMKPSIITARRQGRRGAADCARTQTAIPRQWLLWRCRHHSNSVRMSMPGTVTKRRVGMGRCQGRAEIVLWDGSKRLATLHRRLQSRQSNVLYAVEHGSVRLSEKTTSRFLSDSCKVPSGAGVRP